MSKSRNKKGILVFLLVLLLSISIGYATLSQSLRIEGTANANGKFELQFEDAFIDPDSKVGADDSTALISADGRTLSFNLNLKHPGAGCVIKAKVKNTGDIKAKLANIDFTGKDDPDIIITTQGFVQDQEIEAGDSVDVSISVVWNGDSVTSKSVNFTGTLDYTQSTSTFEANTSTNTTN